MFFNKNKSSSKSCQGSVVIIGTSPLAFLLADITQNNNYKTSILTSLNMSNLEPNKNINIKYLNTQNHQGSFSLIENISTAPDFCIFAPTLDKLRTDYILAQNPILKSVPFINFAHIYSSNFFALLDKNIFAYFKGWINLEKNNLTILNKSPEIKFVCNDKLYNSVCSLFSNSNISISNSDDNKSSFWQNLSSSLLINLLLLIHNQDMSTLLLDSQIRNQIDGAIKELCFLAKKEDYHLNSSEILTTIYSVPNNYQKEIFNSASFLSLLSSLPIINRSETPILHNLFASASKKLIV